MLINQNDLPNDLLLFRVYETYSTKVFCKIAFTSLNSKERHCIFSWFLTHLSPVFFYTLPCFSSRLIRENITCIFAFSWVIFFKVSMGTGRTPCESVGSMICECIRIFVSLDSLLGGDLLEYNVSF